METTKTTQKNAATLPRFVVPDFTLGLYHSNTVNKDINSVREFARKESSVKALMNDLPEDMKNFLDLKLVDAAGPAIKYANHKDAKIQGELTLEFSEGPGGKGTVVRATATFAKYTSKDDGPSDLINLFLKRMKAMIETGVLATTKGQPNGKDESDRQTKH